MANPFCFKEFSATLFEKMKYVNPGIAEMEPYEFCYGLNTLDLPKEGWGRIKLDAPEEIERRVHMQEFFDSIQIKPQVDGRIVLDGTITRLTTMLLVGIANDAYAIDWVNENFYFDIRGFFFLVRTKYFTEPVLAHFCGKPYRQFEQKQKSFERLQDVGYKQFKEANAELDDLFIASVKKLIVAQGTPILLAIAGPTAAGKTEIVERLRESFECEGKLTTSVELDNFFTDRAYREAKGIHSLGKEAMHFDLLVASLRDLCNGKRITIPRYDFFYATSSHELDGKLKPDGVPVEVEPADIIFIEGNFPFLIPEIVPLIGIKVVYLTDDPVRFKRKWKRDIDYRKKYEPTYFRNRYFKEQFMMAQKCYLPQLQVCDLAIDTTGAAMWATPKMAEFLNRG